MEKTQKQMYTAPEIKQIVIDNEISLALESTPPTFEYHIQHHSSDYFNQNPLNA